MEAKQFFAIVFTVALLASWGMLLAGLAIWYGARSRVGMPVMRTGAGLICLVIVFGGVGNALFAESTATQWAGIGKVMAYVAASAILVWAIRRSKKRVKTQNRDSN